MTEPAPSRADDAPEIIFDRPEPPRRSGARPMLVAFVGLIFIAVAFAVWGWGFGFDGRHRTEGSAGAGRAAPQGTLGPIGAGSDTNGRDGGVSSGLSTITGNANTAR